MRIWYAIILESVILRNLDAITFFLIFAAQLQTIGRNAKQLTNRQLDIKLDIKNITKLILL